MATTTVETKPNPLSWLAGLISWIGTTLKIISSNKVGFVGFIGLVIILLITYIGPIFVPMDMSANVGQIYQPPSLEHPLGTDSEGRDVLVQIIHGGRSIISVGFMAAVISTFIALTLGSISAYFGGLVDTILTWIADVVLTIPSVIFLAVLAGIFQFKTQFSIALIIGAISWPSLMRAIRSQVLSLKERDYVEAARCLDLGTPHIIFREIAPNMAGYIAISFTLALTSAMYASVGLIFLGLVPLAGINWGVMLNLAWVRGAIFFKDSLLYILSPIVAISLFQLSLVAFSRSLAEIFDPRLRGGS